MTEESSLFGRREQDLAQKFVSSVNILLQSAVRDIGLDISIPPEACKLTISPIGEVGEGQCAVALSMDAGVLNDSPTAKLMDAEAVTAAVSMFQRAALEVFGRKLQHAITTDGLKLEVTGSDKATLKCAGSLEDIAALFSKVQQSLAIEFPSHSKNDRSI